jgi:outer membrane protein assembly factor BamD (BamD/ComL family)
MNKQEDYEKAVIGFEELLKRYPVTPHLEETVFDLYFCYTKLGNLEKANMYKNWLVRSYPKSKYLHFIEDPTASKEEMGKTEKAATKAYEQVYNLFIEGQFDSALAMKNRVDQEYDQTNWTPQLLYIEAIYYIKQRKDSLALDKLRKIVGLHPGSPMVPKVKTLIGVLTRRKDIENYLTNLKVERAKEDSNGFVEQVPKAAPQEVAPTLKTDSLKSVGVQPGKTEAPVVKDNKVLGKLDSVSLKAPVAKPPIAGYTLQMNAPHYVVILLEKVDPVFANETRNAFNRYNKERFSDQNIESSSLSLDDTHKLVLMSPFPDAISAMDYVDKARKAAPLEIIPWLTTDKYSFMIISENNLEALKNNKDLSGYRKFLNGNFPGKF